MDKTAFEAANPIDGKLSPEQSAKFVKAREEIWELYCNGQLHQRKELGVETVAFLQSSTIPATSSLISYCQKKKLQHPSFHIFVLPIRDLSKYICCADFDEKSFIGMLQPSKNQAKIMTSAVIIDYLIESGRFAGVQGKRQKRKAGEENQDGTTPATVRLEGSRTFYNGHFTSA